MEKLGRKDILVSYTGSATNYMVEVYLDHKGNVSIALLDGPEDWDQKWSHDLMREGKFVLDRKHELFADHMLREWNMITNHIHNVIQNLSDIGGDASVRKYRGHFTD